MGDELRTLTGRYETDTSMLEKQIRLGASFDLLGRKFLVGGQKATLYFVDGFAKDEVMEKILEYLMKLTPEEMRDRRSAEDFSRHFMSYVEVSLAADIPAVITAVLSGTLALLIEGYDQAVMIDARTYPARGVEEPEDDKVLRGAHDGFVETLIFNTALIRRRIRDPQLTMEYLQVGSTSKTDLVLCYMDERVNHKQLRDLRDKLKGIDIPSLTMGQESLAECLLRRQWYNPFPKVRYTERPDCASANVAEGKILLIVDILITTMSVIGRYVPFIPDPAWSEEVVLTCMSYMAVLSAALAIRRGAHIRMTAFDVYLPKIAVKVLDILADLAVCILGLIMLVVGWNYATTLGGRGFYVSMPWLSRFWMYFPVPLAGVAMIIFEIEALYNHIKSIFVKEEN